MVRPLLFFIVFNFSVSLPAKVLIATVAQVKNHVITSREVDIQASVEKALGQNFSHLSAQKPEEQLIRDWLLFFEASAFYNTGPKPEDVKKLLKLAHKKLDSKKSWKALAVTEKELKEKIVHLMQAERIYLFKRKASVLPVSLSEIENEYSQNRVKYGNQTFDEAKDNIRKIITEENLQKRMEEWFSVLEKKYKVQRFSQYTGR